MRKIQNYFILLVLFSFLMACGSGKEDNSEESTNSEQEDNSEEENQEKIDEETNKDEIKNKISLSKVKEVWVREHRAKDSILLDKKQTELFIKSWNTAYPSGPCKFRIRYSVKVFFVNGTFRKFIVNANNIKERTDYCFKMSSTINYTD